MLLSAQYPAAGVYVVYSCIEEYHHYNNIIMCVGYM
jgi:hypothetical protein